MPIVILLEVAICDFQFAIYFAINYLTQTLIRKAKKQKLPQKHQNTKDHKRENPNAKFSDFVPGS